MHPSTTVQLLSVGAYIACLLSIPGCRDKEQRLQSNEELPETHPRVVLIGVDGLDPQVLEKQLSEAKLPNLARMHRTQLETSAPSDHLTAWATALTGRLASAHGVVGDVIRVPGTYRLTPADGGLPWIRDAPSPHGSLQAPPLWTILSGAGKTSRVIRAPASFPPGRDPSVELLCGAGMPDALEGPCRWIVVHSSETARVSGSAGRGVLAASTGEGRWEADLQLEDPSGARLVARLAFSTADSMDDHPVLVVDAGGEESRAQLGQWSDWLQVTFRGDGRQVSSITRMLPQRVDSQLKVFFESPGVDPFAPALPLSSPRYYAGFLADRYGIYGTCSDGTDATAFDEEQISAAAFLRQTYSSWEHQERMTLGELTRDGWDVLISVFPQPGAAMQSFQRVSDAGMPAHDPDLAEAYGDTVSRMYARLDSFLGQVIKGLGPQDRLIVMSVRGQRTVRRELSLNTWLARTGYLALARGPRSSKSEQFADVDWSRTRAYAGGAGGIWINLAGREPQGIVQRGQESETLIDEIASDLSTLTEGTRPVVQQVRMGSELFGAQQGAPDLLVVLEPGYSVNAASQKGAVPAQLLVDSTHPWIPASDAGDSEDASGVILTLIPPAADPAVQDVVPTILEVMDVPIPEGAPGRSFW